MGAHVQTIWPALRFGGLGPNYQPTRERWATPDGDFLDVDRLSPPLVDIAGREAPLLVLFHGLEGSAASHYVQAFARVAAQRGYAFALPYFRGCSGELNSAPRAYHSGDHAEIDWILRRLKAEAPTRPLVAVGVSLGGNALMSWAGVQGLHAQAVVSAVAAISAPLDLAASGHAMGKGFNRLVYTRVFLNTMRPKALQKWDQHPGLFDKGRVIQARTLWEFDNAFTAPVHGFADTQDYWSRASAKPGLRNVSVPALLLNALNDPFVPAWSLPCPRDVSSSVELWQPPAGGHVGFAARRPGRSCSSQIDSMPRAVLTWLQSRAGM
jgi:predicted alpha/beta-fold hydrolase